MINQSIIPVLKSLSDCEKAHVYNCEYVILMDVHLSQLQHACEYLKQYNKKIIIHLDLIKGLKSDEYSVDYVIRELKVDGVISVKSSIIEKVKKLKRIAIQRIFLIDTQSYLKSVELLQQTKPDYIELLPGYSFKMISRVLKELDTKIIAGGLIETEDEYKMALKSGATAITTTKKELLEQIKKQHQI